MKKLILLGWIVVSTLAVIGDAVANCGNDDQEGPPGPPRCPCKCDQDPGEHCEEGENPVKVFSGNVHREVPDIWVWGGVGSHQLKWKRFGNSRRATSNSLFGHGHDWRHSYQYQMTDVNANNIRIIHPDGGTVVYTKQNGNPNLWLPPPAISQRLFRNGTDFYLQKADGYRFHFQKITPATGNPYYQFQDFTDPSQAKYTLTYNSSKQLIKVTEPAGRYLAISYSKILGKQVISKVTTSDGRSVNYIYETLDDGQAVWILLSAAMYGDGTQAVYEYSQRGAGLRPLLAHAVDPRYEGAAVNVKYIYRQNGNLNGFLSKELNGTTGETMFTLTLSGSKYTAAYGNGSKRVLDFPAAQRGQVNSTVDGVGRKYDYSYLNGGLGFLTEKTDPLGRITKYTKTVYDNPIKIEYPNGQIEEWTRDDLDLPLTHTDRYERGNVLRTTTYTRDANHRITRVDYPDGTFETFTYNNFNQVLAHRMRKGGTEHFSYDPRGLKVSMTDAMGNLVQYGYDSSDRLASITDPRGNMTQFVYNERGLLLETILPITAPDATAAKKTYEYNSFGSQTKMVNELGNVWKKSYDEFKRVTSSTDPLGRMTSYSYDLPGGICGCQTATSHPTLITLPTGKKTKITYDKEWQKLSETVGYGSSDAATTKFEYDLTGNLVTVTDPNGKLWKSEYNERNWLKATIDPVSNRSEKTYDLAGNVLTDVRADGGVVQYFYDSMNRMVKTIDPKNQVVQMSYDGGDNLDRMTDPRGKVYNHDHDLLSRLTKLTFPDGSFESYTFDAASNLKTFRNRAGQVKTCTYDERNRNVFCDWNDPATSDISYKYDQAGRLLSVSNSASVLTYTYDKANQLLSEKQAVVGTGGRTVSYGYNKDGLRNRIKYPSGLVVSNFFTARNQIKSIEAAGPPPIVSYVYDLNGNRVQKTLENGTSTSYSYDDDSRMTNLAHQKGEVVFGSFEQGYDSVSRKKFVKRENGKGDVYSYDSIDQLTKVRYETTNPSGSPSNPERTMIYNIDKSGNWTRTIDTFAGVTTTNSFSINSLNQYTKAAGKSVSYDAKGNLKSVSDGRSAVYDAQNRLVKVVANGNTVEFAYDAFNRCVKRTTNGNALYFVWDGWNLIEERKSGGTILAKYVHGANVDEILVKIDSAGSIYHHHDPLGNVTQLTDSSGNLVEKYLYDVYGAPLILAPDGSERTSTTVGNRFMFTGREFLKEVNLYDYRNRAYSPELGRFLQTDPIGFSAGDYNMVRYVGNNSGNLTDAYGLFSKSWFSRTITVEECEVVVIYGHSKPDDPWKFKFPSKCSAGAANTCYPGRTNKNIPSGNQIRGALTHDKMLTILPPDYQPPDDRYADNHPNTEFWYNMQDDPETDFRLQLSLLQIQARATATNLRDSECCKKKGVWLRYYRNAGNTGRDKNYPHLTDEYFPPVSE